MQNKFKYKIEGLISIIACFYFIIFLITLLLDFPLIFTISNFAFIITIIAYFYDFKLLNSLSTPFFIIFIFVVIQDIIDSNPIIFFHIFIPILNIYIILKKKQFSLYIMISASIMYSMWIYSLKIFFDFPYYNCVLFICNNEIHYFITLLAPIIQSIILFVSKKQRKRKVIYIR